MKKYDAIVIGSGIGGLAAALLLLHQNKSVLVLEKNNLIGGRFTSFKKDEFTIDLGVHVISRSEKGPLGEVLRRVGIESQVSYTKVRPISSYNGKTFIFPHDLKDMVPEKEFEAVLRFLSDVRTMSEDEVKSYDDLDVKTFLNQYTKDPLIHSCIWNVTSIYLCLPTWLASAGEFMRCLRWEGEARSSGYPIGGCGVIVKEFVDGINKFGGEIMVGKKVNKIVVEDGKVCGVMAGNEFFQSDMIISNADIKQTIFNMVGPEHFETNYVAYVKELEYSWGGPVLRLALDKKITDMKMLTQFGTTNQEEYYENLGKGIMPDELNLFMVVPTNFSPSLAPEGKQLVNVACPVPLDLPEGMEEKLAQVMLDTVEKYIPNIKEHIIWKEYMSSAALGNLAGEEGAGIGIGQRPGQVGAKRPQIKTPLEGLYIVGAEAGGAGVGTEMAVNSAIEFIDKYC